MVESGPASGVLGRRRARPADRRPERARARHRRHDRQVLADRGRAGEDHHRLLDRARAAARPAIRSWCRSSIWSRSATAAAASPGSTTSESCTSARSRPARCPARRRTDAAGLAATTTDANLALGRINARLLLRRRDRRRHGRRRPTRSTRSQQRLGVDRERGRARRRADRQQQHGQRAQARLASTAATTRATSRWSRSAAAAACTRSRSRTELGIRKVVIPRAADVFSAWGMLMSDLRRDYFLTRLLRRDARRTQPSSTRCSARWRARRARSSRAEGIAAEQVRFLRYGNLRYENQEHAVEVLLPEGDARGASQAELADAFHEAYEREYTYRLDALRSSSSASTSSRSPRSASSTPAPLPVTGRARRRRTQGGARRRLRDRAGSTTPTIYDGELLEPGAAFRRSGDRRDEGHAPRSSIRATPCDVDDYGNLVISIGGDT